METLIHAGLLNALFAAILAVTVAGLAILCRRRPAVIHALWVLVLVKFLVPSVFPVEIPWWHPSPAQPASPEPIAVQQNPASGEILVDQTPNLKEDLSPEPMISEPQVRAATEREQTATPLPVGRGSASGQILPPASENLALASTDPTISSDSSTGTVQWSWEKLVAMVWLTGSLIWLAVAGIRIVRFHRILRLANPGPPEVQIRVGKLAEQLGLSITPSIAFVSAPIAPLLWALTRSPRLLIPSQLWERLNEEQRDTLLVHELAHLRRGDHWVRRLEMVVLALYWWHPAVWWAQRQLREAEEQCCDAWVLWALPQAAQDYAVALVETLAFLSQSRPALPLGASGIEPMRLLKRRLSMIVQGHPPRGMSRLAFWAVIGLGLLLLPLLPVPAQQTANPEGDDEEQIQPPPPPRNPPASPEAPALKSAPVEGSPIQVDRAELIEAARDQVDLMEAKLMIKRAELEEMEMRIRLDQRKGSRLEKLYRKGALPESDLNKALEEAELLPMQLPAKKAELKEAEILLKQAQRRQHRLESAEAVPGGKGGGIGMSPGPAGTPGMMGPSAAPTMQPKGAPMKGPGGLPPGPISGAGTKDGKALPGAPPGGMPGKMGPSLPGAGGPMKSLPGLPGAPNVGQPPAGGPSLPQGPGTGPPTNPRPEDAEGVVLEYDKNAGHAIISIGSDSGIKAGSQLDVFRLKPNPKYLGKIEILAAQEHRALGRLTDGSRFGPLEKGDLVAGKVSDKAGGARTADPQKPATDEWADWAGKTVKFEVRDKPWGYVFEWLSDQTGLPVMMSNDNKPTGKFTYISPKNKEFTIPQVIDILNQSLEGESYLLFRRGKNLYVVSTVIANPLGVGGRESDPPWTNRLFKEKSWNFGTVQRGEKVTHGFELINPLEQPIHISGARTSASFAKAFPIVIVEGGAKARMAEAWISPHQLATIEVEMDTERFAGDKTASVYIQFDQPSAAELRLQVQARSLEAPAGVNDKAGPKARILELENKVDQLMKQIDALRDELKQQPAKPLSRSGRSEAVPGTKAQQSDGEPDEANPAKP